MLEEAYNELVKDIQWKVKPKPQTPNPKSFTSQGHTALGEP